MRAVREFLWTDIINNSNLNVRKTYFSINRTTRFYAAI